MTTTEPKSINEPGTPALTERILLELSTSLSGLVTIEEIGGKVARAAVDLIDCDRALMLLFDPDGSGVRVAGTCGYSPETDALVRSTVFAVPPETEIGGSRHRLRSSETDEVIKSTMTLLGSVASTSIPFRAHGMLLGWLSVTVTEHAERLDPAGVTQRLRALAGQAATAITNARLVDAIRHQSLHDELTGLPNRSLVLDRVGQMLSRARRQETPVAALFIDLDGFKDINDTRGHGTGDRLLQAVAARLAATLRESDTFGRLGGDEFVVLLEGASLDSGAELVAERLLEVLRVPFLLAPDTDAGEAIGGDVVPGEVVSGGPLAVTASIGIAIGDRPSPGDLLRDADVALYAAKAAGKNRCAVFESAMRDAVHHRYDLETDLRGALGAEQFFLVYQPILALATREVTGIEALLRWRHPTRGVVQPDDFIPLLESTGMIIDIGRWVLFTACRQTADWNARGHRLDVAVNVSARQLESDGFVDDVSEALKASGLDPAALVIEMTETTIMRDPDATARRLRLIKALGVRVAIDDFGTGYSSLAYLSQFPVDSLKIDRSFISASAGSLPAQVLIRTLVQLAKSLQMETIAEGIEEEAQYRNLQGQECDSGQGYLFARPLEPDALEDFLIGHAVRPIVPPGESVSGASVGSGGSVGSDGSVGSGDSAGSTGVIGSHDGEGPGAGDRAAGALAGAGVVGTSAGAGLGAGVGVEFRVGVGSAVGAEESVGARTPAGAGVGAAGRGDVGSVVGDPARSGALAANRDPEVAAADAHRERRLGADALEDILVALLAGHPRARVAAVGRDNRAAEMPSSVPVDYRRVVPADDITVGIVADDRRRVSEAFHRATLQGTARVSVHLGEYPGLGANLHYLDLRERHGVFVLVLTGNHLSLDEGDAPATGPRPIRTRFCRIVKDDHSVILDIDERTTMLLGWTPEEMVGRRSLDFVHPEDQQRAVTAWVEMAEISGTQSQARVRYQRRDGSWLWIEVTNSNRLDDAGRPCVVGDLVDISDEMDARQAARASDHVLQQLADALPFGLLRLDADRNIVYTNERLHEIAGSQSTPTVPGRMLNLVSEDRPELSRCLDEVLDHGRGAELAVRLHDPAAEAAQGRTCMLTMRALLGDQGEVTGAIICVADVTGQPAVPPTPGEHGTAPEC